MRRIGLLLIALGLSLMWGNLAQSQQDEGPVLYKDDFSTVNQHWLIQDSENGRSLITRGILEITDYPTQRGTNAIFDEIFSDVTLDVETWMSSGRESGWHIIAFGYHDPRNYHSIAFNLNGVVSARTVRDREVFSWMESYVSSAVRTGEGEINRVLIEVNGTTVRAFINNELIIETEPPGPLEGRIALGASRSIGVDSAENVQVAYDNLVIRVPGEGSQTSGSETVLTEDALAEFHTSGVLEALDEDGDGNPEKYLYDIPSEEPVPGARLTQFLSVEPATGSGDVILIASTSTGQRENFRYTLSIPKSFAEHVDDLRFVLAPQGQITMEVINPDPEVAFNIDVEPGVYTTIMIGSNSVQMEGQDLAAVMHVFEGFDYLRARRACTQPTIYRACIMAMVQTYPAHATEADCDYLAPGSMDYLACRAILTRDPWECSRIGDNVSQLQCYDMLAGTMQRRCQYLTDEAEAACLLDAAVAVNRAEICARIPTDQDVYRRTCEARILQDTAPCQSIVDAERRKACCATFQADADQYAACMGDQQVVSDGEHIEEGETLTLGEVLGAEGSGEDDGQYGTFGPPPAAPNLDYLMNPAFYAEYACEGQVERPRFIASEGQFFYAGDTERSFALPANLMGTMADQGHEGFKGASFFMMGTPGLWMPLDGSVYSLPALTETWATDADSYDRYSALELRPSAETLTVIGHTLDTIRYEGSYTDEVVIDRRDSTFTDGYYNRAQMFVFRAWYDQRTGLLVRSHFEQQPVTCVREGDYADETCPQPLEMICTLVDTSLPIGR